MAKTAVETKTKPAIKQKTHEAPPPADNFKRAKQCLEAIGESWYAFAVAVADIYDNEEYKVKYGEDAKFDVCAKEEWGMAYRTAMNNVQVGQTIKKFGLTKESLAATGINWTNFMEISSTFNPEMTRPQVESRIKKAAKMSHAEVVAFKKEIVHGGSEDPPYKLVTIVLRMKNEAADVFAECMKTAKELMGVEYDDAAMEYVCFDWLNEHDPDKVDEIKAQLKSDLTEDAPEAPEATKPKAARKERADKSKTVAKAEKASPKKKAAPKAKEEADDEDDDDLLGD